MDFKTDKELYEKVQETKINDRLEYSDIKLIKAIKENDVIYVDLIVDYKCCEYVLNKYNQIIRGSNTKLKKYPCYWDHNYNDVRVERVSKISKFDKPSSNEVDLINTLLSFDIDDIELGEYRQKNKILSFFKDLLNADGMEGRISKNRGKSEIELFIFNDGWNVGDEKELYIWLSKK